MNVIGFGAEGCAIIDKLKSHPNYSCYKIGEGEQDQEGCSFLEVSKQPSFRDYELNVPNVKEFFSGLGKADSYFFVEGGAKIGGALLTILEQIKEKGLVVVYIRPNRRLLNKTQTLIERATYGILQELARSGALKGIILLDTAHTMRYTEGIKITEMKNYFQQMVASSFHMLNYVKNGEGVVDIVETPQEINRISTFGRVDKKSGQEIYFYPLDSVREKVYYFAIAEESELWNSHEKLLDNVEKQLKEEEVSTSYKIVSTTYDENHVYMEAFTNVIQLEFDH